MANEMANASETASASETATAMDHEMINRALTILYSKPAWADYVKNFADPCGFIFNNDAILDDIKDTIEEENRIHSGASLAMCLQKCKIILNMT